MIRLLVPNPVIVEVDKETAGAACTSLLAIDHINNDEPLIITSVDIIMDTDLLKIVEDFETRKLAGGIVVFEAVHPRWSYVKCDQDDYVIEAAEKRPISKLATTGFYYFASGSDYVEAATNTIIKDARVEGAFYVCPVYNEPVPKHKKVGIFKIPKDKYFSFSHPDSLPIYEQYVAANSGTKV